jgi:hypothetical protein
MQCVLLPLPGVAVMDFETHANIKVGGYCLFIYEKGVRIVRSHAWR